MRTVDMTRFRLTGAGANGESYDSLDDPNLMLKLYNAEYPVQPVLDELGIAQKVFEIGVPSPQPGELVKEGERLGILFRKVQGKRSYSRALADEPERADEFAREFARASKRLHATICPEGMFETAKSQYIKLCEASKMLTEAEKAKMKKFIMAMPDTLTAVHGDLHMGNILTTLPKGAPLSAEHEVLFIDLGYFATGSPLLDIAMLMNVCLYADEDFRQKEMHVGSELTRIFWNSFVDEYFGKTPEEVEALMQPYVAVKLMLVEFNLGFMPDSYIPLVKNALSNLDD